jgi:hypothetical protein
MFSRVHEGVSFQYFTVRSQVQKCLLIHILTPRSQLHDGAPVMYLLFSRVHAGVSIVCLLCVVKFKEVC